MRYSNKKAGYINESNCLSEAVNNIRNWDYISSLHSTYIVWRKHLNGLFQIYWQKQALQNCWDLVTLWIAPSARLFTVTEGSRSIINLLHKKITKLSHLSYLSISWPDYLSFPDATEVQKNLTRFQSVPTKKWHVFLLSLCDSDSIKKKSMSFPVKKTNSSQRNNKVVPKY